MRELLLLRHAKSRWDEPGTDDHDRGLAPRGVAAAVRMGRLLAEEGLVPDRVLCSTARRALHTWELAAPALPTAPAPHPLRSLYLAVPGRLLEVIRRQDAGARRVLLVGHNPGLETLARSLAGAGRSKDLKRLGEKFPTGALAHLVFEAPDWKDVGPGRGQLAGFHRPRDLDG
jgi:phosphohistidine phosphatase